MDEFEECVHRSWVQLLVDHGYKEEAAIAVDAEVYLVHKVVYSIDGSWTTKPEWAIDIPTSAHTIVRNSESIMEVLNRALCAVVAHRRDDNSLKRLESLPIDYRVKLMEPEEGWREIVRRLITDRDSPNQGLVTEKVFAREGRHPYTYNEMRFASQSEIRIAQEFETRGVLFFPLALAVRAETGRLYQDHREVDFLVCDDGVWGILEVSYHPNRFEKDAEKDTWFKKSGILCVQHYTAERCFNTPSEVVDEFLEILAKHRK